MVEENSHMKGKIWQVCHFRKRSVLRLDLNESRGGFVQRGGGRSFHGHRQKMETAWELTVESLICNFTSGTLLRSNNAITIKSAV